MPLFLERYATGTSYAMVWGPPYEDGSVYVSFVHGFFQPDALDEYAKFPLINCKRLIDGNVILFQVKWLEQVEFLARPSSGQNFELFQSPYRYSVMRHHFYHSLHGCRAISTTQVEYRELHDDGCVSLSFKDNKCPQQ